MKSLLVTGASTGIGRATALYFDERGWRVFASVRKQADADALSAAASDRLTPVVFDVTEEESVQAAAVRITELLDGAGLNGLVNNAGIGVGGPFEYVTIDDWRWQFEVNVFGVVRVTQAFMPLLHKAKGRIANIGSIGGVVTWPTLGPYCASKYAIEAMTDSLRAEIRPLGMHAACIEPGSIQSDIWGKAEATGTDMKASLPPIGLQHYGDLTTKMTKFTELGGNTAIPAVKVAYAVEHALTSSWPRSRYKVGMDAKFLGVMRAILPDRLFESFQRLLIAVGTR